MFLRLVTLWFLSATTALACSCMPPDVTFSYNNYDQSFVGRVLGTSTRGSYRVYEIAVRRPIKGCATSGDVLRVATPRSSATCGTTLQVGETYVLFANESTIGGQTRLVTNMCANNIPVQQLTQEEREFLMDREVCCNGSCECADGSPLTPCFADPCTVTQPCREADTCAPNYCGGCVAEFYDQDGYGVCLPW
jgi:hypothetical protein